MARLPNTYDRRPAPSFGRTRTPAPVVEVDKGAGLIQLGAGITDFAGSMARIKVRDDNFAAIAADTELEAWMLNDRIGDDGWFHIKEGNVTKDLIPERDSRFKSKVDALSSGLANDEQRENFARRAALASNRNKSNLFDHVTKEKVAAHKSAYTASVKLGLESVAVAWNKASEVGVILEKLKDSTATMAGETGVVGDALASAQQEIASAVHAKVIGEALDNDDFRYAKKWLRLNRENMVDEDIDAAEKAIENEGLRTISQEHVDRYIRDGLDITEAKEAAYKHFGKERDAILARIDVRYGSKDSADTAKQKEAKNTAWKIYGETRDINSIPKQVLRDMGGENRVRLQDYDNTFQDEDLTEASQIAADRIMRDFDNKDAALKEAKKLRGKLEDLTIARIDSEYAKLDASEKKGWDDAKQEAYGIFNHAIDNLGKGVREAFDSIPPSVRKRMDQAVLSSMRRMVEIREQGQSVHTMFEPWQMIHKMMKEDPDRFRGYDLKKHVHEISTAHLQEFEESKYDMAKLQYQTTKNSVLRETVGAMWGIHPTTGKALATEAQWAETRDKWDTLIALKKKENNNQDLTIVHFKEIRDEMTIEIKTEEKFFLNPVAIFDDKDDFYGFTGWYTREGIAATVDIPGIPEKHRNLIPKYAAAVKRKKTLDAAKKGIRGDVIVTHSDVVKQYNRNPPKDD